MDTDRKQSFAELEDTENFASILSGLAAKATYKAFLKARKHNIPVTYLDGRDIVKIDAQGHKTFLERLEYNPRQVTVGTSTQLSKA